MSDYMVVYPKSNRSILAVAHVEIWEEDRYDLASKERFEDREQAEGHARMLARKHGLALDKEISLLLDNEPPVENGEMRLYAWDSHALPGYYVGRIIVMATSVEVAREMARRRFEAEIGSGYEAMGRLEEDLAAEPDLLPSGVALISGGD